MTLRYHPARFPSLRRLAIFELWRWSVFSAAIVAAGILLTVARNTPSIRERAGADPLPSGVVDLLAVPMLITLAFTAAALVVAVRRFRRARAAA